MSTEKSNELAALWERIHQQLEERITGACRRDMVAELDIQNRVEETCRQLMESKPAAAEEFTRLLQIISLLEERTSQQDRDITELTGKLEKLEEEMLQTRIEHAKHQLDFMEKLAGLQQRINQKLGR